jgi:hypothetical protein
VGLVPPLQPLTWPHATATVQPRILRVQRRNAPRRAPCPNCGKKGKRTILVHRTVRDLAYQAVLLIQVTTAEYRATCDCCSTFRTQVEGIEPKARYSNRIREAVLDRLLADQMSMQHIQQAMRRDFFLDLSDGFLYDCLDWKTRQLDAATYRQWTLQHFSGTLCIDELHLGSSTLLLATDPLSDFPVAFAVVQHNDQPHLERFLGNLQRHGFAPRVVITDGSNLYPTLVARIWPTAEHQLCVFHVLKDINQCVLDALRRLRRKLQRQGNKGRRRKRGRPRRQQRTQQRRRGPTLKEKANYVYKHRYLLVKRRDRFSTTDDRVLGRMVEYLPALRTLRTFVDHVYGLFQRGQTAEQARRSHRSLFRNTLYAADPDLAQALTMLAPEKFEKMIAFLRSPVGQRVRTNNHVERTNRQLRLFEKVRYKWRRRRTIVRFVLLVIQRQWAERVQRERHGPKVHRQRGADRCPPEARRRQVQSPSEPPERERAA